MVIFHGVAKNVLIAGGRQCRVGGNMKVSQASTGKSRAKHGIALVVLTIAAALLASCSIAGSGPELNVFPPGIEHGVTDFDYGFQFQVLRVPRGVSELTFTWNLSGRPDSEASETVPVRFRRATHNARYKFDSVYEGELAVSVTGKDVSLNAIHPVTIGVMRSYAVAECGIGDPIVVDAVEENDGFWVRTADGFHGTTLDTWNIAAVPAGAVFDIEYDALNKPDRYRVYYADEMVLDTGWRGRADFDRPPTTPLAGPGVGKEEAFLTRGAADTFKVSIEGPHPGTIWRYSIRCRVE
jgi:hypothetical protein